MSCPPGRHETFCRKHGQVSPFLVLIVGLRWRDPTVLPPDSLIIVYCSTSLMTPSVLACQRGRFQAPLDAPRLPPTSPAAPPSPCLTINQSGVNARTLNYDIVQGTRRRAEVVTREVCCVRTTAYVTVFPARPGSIFSIFKKFGRLFCNIVML